nr:hypothetical protein [Tanacetum cinerariifolium]
MSDHEDEKINKENAPPKVVSQITIVTNISTKFPYLKKGEYDIWAMRIHNFILSYDLLCWNIILKGNSAKYMTTDNDGNLKIRPPVTAEEHQQARFGGNAESNKMQKSLLKQKFEEFKISKEEGLDKGYDKMQKILTQMNTLKIKPDPEDVNMKFLRGLPPSWSGIALILKTKEGLEYISFNDLYNKLKFLEIDTKGYLCSSSTFNNAAFVSTTESSQCNFSYQESRNGGHTTTISVSPGSSSSKGSSKSKCSVVGDVIYSFFVNHEIGQHLVYEDLDQMNKEDFEEYDLKHQMAMLSIKVHRFEKKHGRKIKFNGRENASIDWDKQTEEGNTKPRSLENFGMVAGLEIASDADSEGEVVYANDAIPAGVSVFVGDVAAAVVSLHFETEFALMGLSTEGQPIYNRFASVDHMKAVPSPLTGNYMPPSNIPDIDESHMVYGKKATDSSEIKTNDDSISHSHDSVLFDFSDRSSKPSTKDFQMCDSSQECSRPNNSDHDFIDSTSSVFAPASESRDTIVIDCDKQEDFPSVCSIETDIVTFMRTFAKRNAEGKGKLGRRPTGKPVNLNRPKPVSAGQPNPVSAGKATLACNSIPLSVSTVNGILGPRPLNIQPKTTYFHSFTHNN